MGQALLPEHFYAQEESLRGEAGIRFRMRSAPSWGLASLTWDEFQLLKGIISVQELTLVLPSGALVDIPGSHIAVSALPEAPAGMEIDRVDVIIRLRRK